MQRASRTWARVGLCAVAVVLALTVFSALRPPVPCGALPHGYPPIIAFELARDGRDLAALFGEHPGECRARMVAAMDLANKVDLALFMPGYGLFLLGFFLSDEKAPRALARLGAALTVGAVLFDLAENVCLLSLTPGLDAASPWLERLRWATSAKWLGLGAAGLLAGLRFARGGLASKAGAAVCLLAPALAVGAVLAPARFGPSVTAGIAASWIVCLAALVQRARA